MKRKKSLIFFSLVMAVCILFSGCTFSGGSYSALFMDDVSADNSFKLTYKSFSGYRYKNVNVKRGQEIDVIYDLKSSDNNLKLQVVDPDNNIIDEVITNNSGNHKIKAEKSGSYKVYVKADKKSQKGTIDVSWNITK